MPFACLMNVLCTQLSHTRHHVIAGGWEEMFGVDVESSAITGNQVKLLRTLFVDVQATKLSLSGLELSRWRVGYRQALVFVRQHLPM